MSYVLTPDQINSVTDVEEAFGTVKLLPEWDEIPIEFKQRKHIECKIAFSMFHGSEMPSGTVVFKDGFEPEAVLKCMMAHLRSFQPKHERKMAGVAYMLSLTCTITPNDDKVEDNNE